MGETRRFFAPGLCYYTQGKKFYYLPVRGRDCLMGETPPGNLEDPKFRLGASASITKLGTTGQRMGKLCGAVRCRASCIFTQTPPGSAQT